MAIANKFLNNVSITCLFRRVYILNECGSGLAHGLMPRMVLSMILVKGYSKADFDNQHRVLKGGSWANRPWALSSSFRNWYHSQFRQILAGFRRTTS